jgi:hypothetical protein
MIWPKKKPFEKWKIDPRREPCCSQWRPLIQSGFSEVQGPTHYCPVCRWAFWPVTQQPSQRQLDDLKLDYPSATLESVSYIKLCTKPPIEVGRTVETTMIDQLGGSLNPSFLTRSLKEYWVTKYCEKYPDSIIAKNMKEFKKKEERRYK